MSTENWLDAVGDTDLPPGKMRAVELGGVKIALYNVEGDLFATSNICTHAFAFLTDGWLEDHLIECPLHAGQFDIRDGKGQGAPITCDLQTFAVRVRDGRIEVSVG